MSQLARIVVTAVGGVFYGSYTYIYQVLELNVYRNSVSYKYLVFAKHGSVRAFIFRLARLDFLHLRILLNYKFLKHALCSSNNVLLSVARSRKLSKDSKSLEYCNVAPCENEFCSVGLLQQFVRRFFEESLL